MATTKRIVGVNQGSTMSMEIDGIKYDFRITEYSNVGEYAPILIIDNSTGNHYMSYGYLELNGHIFISKWEKVYADYRENWICSDNLIITVN